VDPLAKLPPFAPVAIRLLKQFDREDAEVSEVAKLVAADPALVSEILAVSNSALFSPVVPVTVHTVRGVSR